MEQILQDFEQYTVKGMKDRQVPGMAVAVVRGNETIYLKGFGVRKINSTDPVTPNTIFQIGSTTKGFTATLVGTLVDEGLIKWDDRVIDHLPDFQMYDPWVTHEFTVTDLMAMRSGLATGSGEGLCGMGFNRSFLMHSLRYMQPETSFRSAYAYQNLPFLWAAALVENKIGKSWEENIQEKIFSPLNMSDSSTDQRSFQLAQDVAYLHVKKNGKIVALPMDQNSTDWVYTIGPAGGINSNIEDMVKWLCLQMNNGSHESRQLLSKNTIQYLQSPKTVMNTISTKNNAYYCQGWMYMEACPYPIVFHKGGTQGHSAIMAFVPQAKIGIVILSNVYGDSLPDYLMFRFLDLYFSNNAWDDVLEALKPMNTSKVQANASTSMQTDSPLAARPLETYVGNYSNQTLGIINISQDNGILILYAGPGKLKIPLMPLEGDNFSLSKTGAGPVAAFLVVDENKMEGVEIRGGRLFDLFGNNIWFQHTND
ncbi:serine hydrolase [Methanothrix sp.]|uniref:serine hydrolase n=2 Tax=Methanothrix sp. TaxID=90426 RepID=UPI003BB5434A